VRTLKIFITAGILLGVSVVAFGGASFFIQRVECCPNVIKISTYLECPGYVYVFVAAPDSDNYYLIYPSCPEENRLLCTCWQKTLGYWRLGKAGVYRFIFMVTTTPTQWCPGKIETFYDMLWRAKNILWIIEGMVKTYQDITPYYWTRVY